MAFTYFESMMGGLSNAAREFDNLGVEIKYGLNYNIKGKFEDVGDTKGKRKNAFFSNVATMMGKIECEIAKDLNVYDGMNNMILGKNGEIDVELVNKVFLNTFDMDKDDIKTYTRYMINNLGDNMSGVLYNMLRMLYIKDLQENYDITIKKDDCYYDDGHVYMTYADVFNLQDDIVIKNITNNPRNTNELNLSLMNVYTLPTNSVVKWHGILMDASDFTIDEMSVIKVACDKFDFGNIPIKLFHDSPRVSEVRIMSGTLKGSISDINKNLSQLNYTTILSAICKLVESMRIQAHFDYAYFMLTQVMYSHKPRSAEAILWHAKKYILKLPKSSTSRGISNCIVSGTPFVSSVERYSTYKNWLNQKTRIVLHSIAFSEALHCGTFDYNTRDVNQHDRVLTGVIGSTRIKHTGAARESELAAMRFGYSSYVSWPTNTGLMRYNWMDSFDGNKIIKINISDPEARNTYKIIMRNDIEYLKLDTIVPMCYPVLSMGIEKSKFYMNELQMDVSLKYSVLLNGWVTDDIYTAHRSMAILRTMGWNITVKRMSDGARFTNWAPNSNGHYLPTFNGVNGEGERYILLKETLSKRSHCWIEMPMIRGELKLSLELEYITMQIKINGIDVNVAGNSVIIETINTDKLSEKVLGAVCYIPVVDDNIDIVKAYQDFRKVWKEDLSVQESILIAGQ